MKRINWADALVDLVEIGPIMADTVAGDLGIAGVGRSEVLAGAQALPGAYRDARTGSIKLPPHEHREKIGTMLSDLTYAAGDYWRYSQIKARLRQRWARGNFAIPRDVGQLLRDWRKPR